MGRAKQNMYHDLKIYVYVYYVCVRERERGDSALESSLLFVLRSFYF